MTAVLQQCLQQVAQLCDEVEIGDGNGQLQLLDQLAGIHALQHKVHGGCGVFGKQLLQQPCLCSVTPIQPTVASASHMHSRQQQLHVDQLNDALVGSLPVFTMPAASSCKTLCTTWAFLDAALGCQCWGVACYTVWSYLEVSQVLIYGM